MELTLEFEFSGKLINAAFWKGVWTYRKYTLVGHSASAHMRCTVEIVAYFCRGCVRETG